MGGRRDGVLAAAVDIGRRRGSLELLTWAAGLLFSVGAVGGLVLSSVNGRGLLEVFSVLGVTGVIALAYPGVGALIAARRPGNAVGWVILATGGFAAAFLVTHEYAIFALVTTSGPVTVGGLVTSWIAAWVWVPCVGLLALLLLWFPDGRAPSRRWAKLGWVAGAATLGVVGLLAAGLWSSRGLTLLESLPLDVPVSGAAGVALTAAAAAFWLCLLAATGCVGSLFARFRNAASVERQQIKWLLFAGAVTIAGAVTDWFFWWGWFLNLVGPAAIIAAIAAAIFRYRLYEIDRIISRTVSYALLSVLLVAVYLGGVFGFQQLLRPVTGESQLAVAGATLLVAGLFQPARHRVQVAVDRRFNRARYDAQRTVDAFRARLRDEVDLAQLDAELVGAVRSTVEPAQVWLWLRPPETRTKP